MALTTSIYAKHSRHPEAQKKTQGSGEGAGPPQLLPWLTGRRRERWGPVTIFCYMCQHHSQSLRHQEVGPPWLCSPASVLSRGSPDINTSFLSHVAMPWGWEVALLYALIPEPQILLSSDPTIFRFLDPLHPDCWRGIRKRKGCLVWPSQPVDNLSSQRHL